MSCRAITLALILTLTACSDAPNQGGAGGVDTVGGTGNGGGNGGGGFQAGEALGVEVTPTVLSFGVVAMGSVETRTVEVRHSGTSGTLELTRVEYQADSGTDLSVAPPERTSLEVGEATELTVSYAPTDATRDQGTLVIETNAVAADGSALVVSVPVEASLLSSEISPDKAIIAFGAVATGTTATETLTLLNLGSLDLTVEAAAIESASPDEFTVADDLPAVVTPGAQLTLEVSYTPAGQDTDTGALKISYSAADGDGDLSVPVNGHEVSAELVVTPDPLDFGLRPPGTGHVEMLTLTSGNSQVPLEVTGVSVVTTGEWSGTVTVEPWPVDGVIIGEGESQEVAVTFTPVAGMVSPATPLAEIAFATNDPTTAGVQTVDVHGQRRGNGLEVHPPDIVYFGYVGVGGTVYREVTLYNAGNAAITVDNVHVEGDFNVFEGENWPPTHPNPEPAALDPGALQVVTARFTNTGGVLETTWGKLVIASDDEVKPNWEVLLNALKVEGGDCVVQLVPSALDYGLMTPWTEHALSVSVVNIGSNDCAYHSAIVDDCAELQVCEVSPDEEMAATSSVKYAVTAEPGVGTALGPGESLPIEVTFTAPEAGPVITPHPGLLRARMTAVSGDTGAEVVVVHPSASSWLTIPNLLAEVGVGQLEVAPPEVDFQLVEIGCVSPPVVITGTNVGMAHLEVTGWWLEGCTDEVSVLEAPDPDASHTLQVGESLSWTVDYGPVDQSSDACALAIASSDAPTPTEVALTGWGAYPAQVADLFTDSESQKVDVLFVVDDSGSMGQEQENLSDSFQAFILEAATWDSDYQIGVTTTTVNLLELAGGALFGSPPWVSVGNWEKFVNIVEVGVGGSGNEQGIWAALIATSSPLIDPPEGTCEANSDCGLMRACVAGTCQGINHGFLRDDAALEVVFVSDEEDQSPEELDGYLDHFRAIKGFDKPELLHMHAIVGPPGGCTSSNGTADAGLRYASLASATGGAFYSICELDFAKGLEGIGEIAFASKMEYTLSQIPVPTTLAVTIEGLPCPPMTGGIFNWVYDPDDNQLTLTEQGICTAGPGDEVLIAYDLLCYAEAD